MPDLELSSYGDFLLGEWVVQPRLSRITRGDRVERLEPRCIDLLAFLARHPEEVHSRERLIDEVWRVEAVAENTLTHAIAALRKALGDDARNPRYIETIHRRGYRLLIAPGPISDEDSSVSRTLSHYLLLEHLGGGGMGVVYRAKDTKLRRDVALKFLPKALSSEPEARERFIREARAASALDHPHICTIHEIDETPDGQLFIVMAFYEGETLKKKIERGPLPVDKAVLICGQVAEGLQRAHEAGIVHRDIKPANVMVTSDGVAKIVDFGLAKLRPQIEDVETEAPTGSLKTSPGTVIGTVAYMAPEQVRGEPADHRSDIFALGCVLYEMLAGERPFRGSTTVETAAAILKEDPEPISVAAPAVSPGLGSVVSKCLEKRPEDRFSSAHDLSLTLGAIDTTASQEQSVISKRWPHILAVVIAAGIALFFIFPPEGLFERLTKQPAEAGPPRIVVLPFENLGSPNDEYFADGITEEITSRLAAVSGLQVISRTSAMYYKGRHVPLKQVGEELDVGYVLEGSIRWDRSGEGHGRVRITPQLIKVDDDTHLWSDRYDRVLEDIFTVQSDIAEQVIFQLQATLLEPERRAIEARPTENIEAYQIYLFGVQYFSRSRTKENRSLALTMFQRAVNLDPDFAVAHARLSETHANLYHHRWDFTAERLEQARASAERALALEPGLPEGHRALGFYYYYGFRDYDRAMEEFAIASKGLPNDTRLLAGIAYALRRQGKWEEAIETIRKWGRLDPQAYLAAVAEANTHSDLREYARAEQAMRRAIAIAPDRPDAYMLGVQDYVRWDGATTRARLLVDSAPSQVFPYSDHYQIWLDELDRKPESAWKRLEESREDMFGYQPREFLECIYLSQMGDRRRTGLACRSAVDRLEQLIDASPNDDRLYGALGHSLALLEKREEAVRAGKQAVELLPISKDAMVGPAHVIELAKIYTRVGDYEESLDLIEELLSIPCSLSVGLLRLDPVWDPLRDHPRFQALLEEYDTN